MQHKRRQHRIQCNRRRAIDKSHWLFRQETKPNEKIPHTSQSRKQTKKYIWMGPNRRNFTPDMLYFYGIFVVFRIRRSITDSSPHRSLRRNASSVISAVHRCCRFVVKRRLLFIDWWIHLPSR